MGDKGYKGDKEDSMKELVDLEEEDSVSLMEGAMGLVKTELFAVAALQRDFYWFRSALWPSELESCGFKSLVVVSAL